jgi:hypothetical protein
MRNRIVGFLIIGIAALIAFIAFSFNRAMTDIVNTSCSHGPECAMWGSIDFQTNVSIGIIIFVVVIGLYLIFFGKEEKIITKIKTFKPQVEGKRVSKESYKKVMSGLSGDERSVFGKIIDAQGSISQSELVAKTNFHKVKVSRVLDRLEGKALVERKRRGMTNVVVLRH